MDENGSTNRIDELNKRLYSKDEKMLRRTKQGILHPKSYDVPTGWKSEESQMPPESVPMEANPTTKKSIFKMIFLGSLAVFLLTGGYAAYTYFFGGNTVSNENIDLNILGNSYTAGGAELSLEVEVTNRNSVPLELADLLMEYPKGGGDGDTTEIVRLPRVSLGTIAPGKSASQNVKVVLFGEQGSVKTIKASIEYRVQGSSAIFIKEITYPITINSAPVALSIDAPTETTSNQEITMKVKVVSNADAPLPHMLVQVQYPAGFTFTESTPDSAYNNNTWELGDLGKGMTREIVIKGTLQGEDGEERAFRVYTGEADPKDATLLSVTYTSLLHTIAIKKSFLATDIVINGADTVENVVGSERDIRVDLNWVNNLPTRITDAEITATISGNAFDKSSLHVSNGFYDSLNNKIIWDKTTSSSFASIEPGEQGGVSFDFTSLPLYAAGSLIQNPQITIAVGIKGKEPSLGGIVSEVTNTQSKVIKISSDLQIAGQATHFQGPFTNTGPIPPRAEQETTYTITWSVTNSSNDVRAAEAVAVLPTFVRYVGTTSPSSEVVSYDETTRTVSWKLGNVLKGTGLTSALRQASFQVALTPSTSQIGSVPQLILETVLTGTDTYTNTVLRSARPQLTTTLYNDASFTPGMDRVTQ